jgi:hypothetical protein
MKQSVRKRVPAIAKTLFFYLTRNWYLDIFVKFFDSYNVQSEFFHWQLLSTSKINQTTLVLKIHCFRSYQQSSTLHLKQSYLFLFLTKNYAQLMFTNKIKTIVS